MDCCVLSVKSKLAVLVMERGKDSSVVRENRFLNDVVSRKGNQRFLIVLDGSYLLPICPRCIQVARLRCPGRRSRCAGTGGKIQVSYFGHLQHVATLISLTAQDMAFRSRRYPPAQRCWDHIIRGCIRSSRNIFVLCILHDLGYPLRLHCARTRSPFVVDTASGNHHTRVACGQLHLSLLSLDGLVSR